MDKIPCIKKDLHQDLSLYFIFQSEIHQTKRKRSAQKPLKEKRESITTQKERAKETHKQRQLIILDPLSLHTYTVFLSPLPAPYMYRTYSFTNLSQLISACYGSSSVQSVVAATLAYLHRHQLLRRRGGDGIHMVRGQK